MPPAVDDVGWRQLAQVESQWRHWQDAEEVQIGRLWVERDGFTVSVATA